MKKSIGILIICLALFSCNNEEVKKEKEFTKKETTLGKYIYFDQIGILHTKNGCKAVYKDHNMQMVRPVNISGVTENNLNRICSQCVTEDQIAQLLEIIEIQKLQDSETDTVVIEDDMSDW